MEVKFDRPKFLVGGLLVALVGGVVFWFFSRGYGDVSQEGYRYALALYSACNRQSSEHVQRIADKLEVARARSELQPREYQWLRQISERALRGDWEAASQSIRRLMEDQIRPASHPTDS